MTGPSQKYSFLMQVMIRAWIRVFGKPAVQKAVEDAAEKEHASDD